MGGGGLNPPGRGDFLDLTGESPPGACIDLTGEEEEPPLAARRATRRGKLNHYAGR